MRKYYNYFWQIKVETNTNNFHIDYYMDKKFYMKKDALKELVKCLEDEINSFPFLRINDFTIAEDGMSYKIEKLCKTVSIERFDR